MSRYVLIVLAVIVGTGSLGYSQGDPEVIAKVIEEGKNHSQVWDHLTYLSEEIGPRLTGSTALDRAHAWTRDRFRSFGLDTYLQKWGEIPVRFDRGDGYVKMVQPTEQEFEYTTRSWSAGTNGPVSGKVIKEPQTLEELESVRDQLPGAWILSKQQARRGGGGRRGRDQGQQETDEQRAAREAQEKVREEITAALNEAGISGRIVASRSDIVVTGGERNWRELTMDTLPTDVTITVRRIDYDVMNSRLADGEEVTVEANLQHNFVEGPIPLYNTIAEIPGTDRPDEVVIVSGHLDSWDGPGTQGCQDNGTGCSTTIEAARLLMAAGAKPKRTIRFILWSGEEQGLLGSSAYVDSLSEEEKSRISAVFVDDGGTNYVGGVSCIASMESMLAEAIAPVQDAFPDLPMELQIRDRMSRFGGSDHAPFVRAGIPGFFYAETGIGGAEGKDYNFIHHTQHDIMRYAIREYLVQSAVCSAVLTYNLACAETLLPRELPEEEEGATPAEPEVAFVPITGGPVAGNWVGHLVREGNPSDAAFTMVFEMGEGGQVRGSVTSDYFGTRSISKGLFKAEEHALRFEVPTEGGGDAIVYAATVDGETMKGTLSLQDAFSFEFEAKHAIEAMKVGGGGR